MRKLIRNTFADMDMILTAVVMAIVFAVSIVIVFSILGGIDTIAVDIGFGGHYNVTGGNWTGTTHAFNATNDVIGSVNTFYTIGPIAIIVVAAVGIIGYIMLIRVKR